jgi:tetratricopeptide (TPR) repeat protein
LGVAKDEAQAARLFRQAADAGELGAAEWLAHMLHYGTGVPVDLAGAEALYRQVIAGTGSTSTRNSLAWLFAEQGIKLDEAEMLAREAVRSTPDPLPTRANYVDTLAWVLFKQGRLDEAATLMEGIVDVEPRRPVIVAHLGDIYAGLGRTEEARAAWRDALAIEDETGDDGNFDRAAIEAKLAE